MTLNNSEKIRYLNGDDTYIFHRGTLNDNFEIGESRSPTQIGTVGVHPVVISETLNERHAVTGRSRHSLGCRVTSSWLLSTSELSLSSKILKNQILFADLPRGTLNENL